MNEHKHIYERYKKEEGYIYLRCTINGCHNGKKLRIPEEEKEVEC
jgi:hypothetical protein